MHWWPATGQFRGAGGALPRVSAREGGDGWSWWSLWPTKIQNPKNERVFGVSRVVGGGCLSISRFKQ